MQVAESEKEAAIQMVLAEGWQREVALLQPQLGLVQKQLADTQRQVGHFLDMHCVP